MQLKHLLLFLLLSLSAGFAGEGPSFSDRSYDRLVEDYRVAHSLRNPARLEALVCWDGVPENMQRAFMGHLKKTFVKKLKAIHLEEISEGFPLEYERGGLRYRPNRKALAQLVLTFETKGEISRTRLLVGEKEGRKLIVTAAPVKK
jgi:hypothetical protein